MSSWPRWEIEAAIREHEARHGSPPKATDWTHAAPGRPTYNTVRNQYGSWQAGLRAAGVEPQRPRWSKGEIVTALREQATPEGVSVSSEEWVRRGLAPSRATVVREMGSWSRALAAAGLLSRPPTRTVTVTVALPVWLAEALDEEVEAGRWASRSHAVRVALDTATQP